jgi:hypothetical protein
MTMGTPTQQTRSLTEATLAEITRRLVAALSPQGIYLFGSHAYGTARESSDVDVLVILPSEDFSTWDMAKRAYGALDGMALPIELHFTWQDRFNRLSGVHGTFDAEIRAKGRLLYAA